MRYATYLQNFDFAIRLQRSEDIPHADYLSRAPVKGKRSDTEIVFDEESTLFVQEMVNTIADINLNYDSLKSETEKDNSLSSIVKILRTDSVLAQEKYDKYSL